MEFHLSSGEESISSSYRKDEEFGISIASADRIFDGRWYVSRVMVRENHRGKGVGSKLLNMMIEEIKSRPDKGDIIVTPGGYDGDTKRQFDFYKKNGFVETDKPEMLIYVLT